MDTHILIRWLSDPRKLSRQQLRALESAVKRGEPVAFSAITLLELVALAEGERRVLKVTLDEFFQELSSNPVFRVLPLTYEVAREVASFGHLKDPVDRVIAATASVHRLQLVTSDVRIIDSGLVTVIE